MVKIGMMSMTFTSHIKEQQEHLLHLLVSFLPGFLHDHISSSRKVRRQEAEETREYIPFQVLRGTEGVNESAAGFQLRCDTEMKESNERNG